jgi:diguanylate cyclase (GGDEF)-like protein
MSGAGFILAINFVVAGLFAASFLAVALYDTHPAAPRWFAFGYMLGALYFSIEFAIFMLAGGSIVAVLSFSVALASFALFNVGLAHKYRIAVPWRLMAVVFLLSVVACAAIQGMPRGSILRMFVYQAPYFVMQAIGVWIIHRSSARAWLDRVLEVALAASALHFLSKPLLMQLAGGTGASVGDYLKTDYAMISQTLGAIFGIGVALLALIILVRDILAEVTAKSEMDTLSGLLNRRGFERLAALSLEHASRQGMPVALVIADLDHFKVVNDTYGHASGDRAIQAFASFLQSATRAGHIAARLGGEEFAIVLPGANLVAARLLAEGARSAFSALPINGLPAAARVTASFGVAELLPSEGLSSLMARADEALYAAKKAGRDCVRVARLATIEPTRGLQTG